MKKLLSMIGAMTLIGTASAKVIACGGGETPTPPTPDTRTDISTKIPNDINLGQLSANSVKTFLANLQTELVKISELNTITSSDYAVYKAGAGTVSIQDSDISAGTSLNIKIVAKGSKFKCEKDNIKVQYIKMSKIDLNAIANINIESPIEIEVINRSAVTIKELENKLDQNLNNVINNVVQEEANKLVPGLYFFIEKNIDYTYDIKNDDGSEITTIDLSKNEKKINIIYKSLSSSKFITGDSKPITVTLPIATNLKRIIKATTYIDEHGYTETTEELDLSNKNIKKIVQIGFFENEYGYIQVVQMPKTIEKVPDKLPREITSLKNMFMNCWNFNQDLSTWDVSNVTDMDSMFDGASSFNQDISNWDTSNVTNMSCMFYNAKAFNQNINTSTDKKKWNVEKVDGMLGMFWGAKDFNQDISNWDTSNVKTMNHMFSHASSFNQNINTSTDGKKWNVSNVADMEDMFFDASSFNNNISNWDTSNVTKMSGIFRDASSFNNNISNWNTSNVKNMRWMFMNCKNFNQDLSTWDVSNVTDMASMFDGASSFNQDISNWNVNNVNKYHDFATNSGIFSDKSKWPSKFR